MNKVYIVVESGGEYEDAWNANRAAFLDRDKAQCFVDDAKKRQAEKSAKRLIMAEFFKEYVDAHERPNRQRADAPRWDSGLGQLQITKQMRAERSRIFEMNQELLKEFTVKLQEWQAIALIAINEKRLTLGMEPKEFFVWPMPPGEESSFEIQEIDLINN